jgi:hypothetical protein
MERSKPHFEKLIATLENPKLPKNDVPKVKQAIEAYQEWINNLEKIEGSREEVIYQMVNLTNQYKLYIELNLIFDSTKDFLYRQKGQLKLDNTIIEEFLPLLVSKAIPELSSEMELGPRFCYSTAYFTSSLGHEISGGGLHIKTKAQDFAIARKLYLKSSHDSDFSQSIVKDTYLGYIVAECKTNLDKTMFQEAAATAHDLKAVVPGAKYFLLCEWLDMTPVSTAPTDIEEVLILRKAKRLSSKIRSKYNTYENRKKLREQYKQFLINNPYRGEVFKRFIEHILGVLNDQMPNESEVLKIGYF